MASHTTNTSTVYEVVISVATLSTELIGVTPLILLDVKLPTDTNCPACACEAGLAMELARLSVAVCYLL